MIINAAHAYKRESITHFTERAQISLKIQVFFFRRAMFRFGCIQPPTIHSDAEHIFIHIFPIDISRYRIISIIYLHTIILRKSFMYHQLVQSFQISIDSGSGSKRRPHRNNSMGIQMVHLFHHFLWIGKFRITKFYRIPIFMVFSPITPILNNAIQRHLQVTIFRNNANQFILADISLS